MWFGKSVEVQELRWYNQAPVIFLKDINDRTVAESLIKAILIVAQDTDALPSEPDAWYDHQLVGLSAQRDGVTVGLVSRVEHLPAQDVLVIKTPDREVMVPFVKAFVPSVDVAAGVVTLTPPLGLFEDLVEDDVEPELDSIRDQPDARQ